MTPAINVTSFSTPWDKSSDPQTREALWRAGHPCNLRRVLSVLTQPFAILRGDEGSKPRHTWIIRVLRLQISENFPQGQARHRPIVRALLQHQARVADRPAHDLFYEAVHRGARCLSVGDNNLGQAVANAAPLTSWTSVPI
jgi:hypothetical protein